MMKSCKQCGKEKPYSDFKRVHNYSCLCSECHDRAGERNRQNARDSARAYYRQHREKCLAYNAAWYAAHPGYYKRFLKKRDPVKVAKYWAQYWIKNRERITAKRRKQRVLAA